MNSVAPTFVNVFQDFPLFESPGLIASPPLILVSALPTTNNEWSPRTVLCDFKKEGQRFFYYKKEGGP